MKDEIKYLDHLGGVLQICKRDLTVEYCSFQSESILGYTSKTIKTTPNFWISHIYSDYQELFMKTVQELSFVQKVKTINYLFKVSTGDYRWVQSRIFLFKEDDNVEKLSIFTIDIHAQQVDFMRSEEDRSLNTELLKHLSHVFFLFTQTGRFIRWNNRLVEVSGFNDEEIQEMHPLDFFPEAAKPYVEQMIQSVLQNGRVEMEAFFKARDGSMKPIHFIGSRFNYKGEVCISGVAIDISLQKNAEQELRNSEKRFRSLVQEGSDMIAILDENGKYQYVSSNYSNIVGYEPKYLLGKNGFDFFHPDDLEKVYQEFVLLQSQKRITSSPYRFKRKDGTWCWMQSTGTNMSEDETIQGIIVNTVDITNLIEAQQALNESNKLYETVNKVTNDAIYDWDIVNNSFSWGEGFSRIFGYEISNDFTIEDWRQIEHQQDRSYYQSTWEEFLKNEKRLKWHCELRIKHKNGNYIYSEEIGHLIRDKSGKPIRMIGVLRDISQRKKQELQKEIQHDIAELFTQDLSLEEILTQTSRYLWCKLNIPVVEFWMNSNDQKVTHRVAYSAQEQVKNGYESVSFKRNVFDFGIGFPGVIWQNDTIQIWSDLEMIREFIRKDLIAKIGIKCLVGMPMLSKDSNIGQLIFMFQNKDTERKHWIDSLDFLIQQLGEEISRKRQEIELQLLFNSAPDILAVAGPNGHFVKVNPAFCNLLGCTEDEIIARPFTDFLHPNDIDVSNVEYSDTITGERKSKGFLNRYRTKSGDYRWISWSSSDRFSIDDYVYSYGRDVTQMLELQNMLDDATNLSKIGAWEYNVLKRQYYWSPMMREIHGINHGFELNQSSVFDFFREDFKELAIQKIERSIVNFESFDFEAVITTLQGDEKWIRIIGSAEVIQGRCVRVFGSFQDIHEKKEIELRLKNVSDNIPGVIFQYVFNPNTRDENLRYVSEGSTKIWGFEPEECVQNKKLIWNGIKLGGDFNVLRKIILESIKSQEPWHARWRYILPDGRVRYHEAYGNPNKTSVGEIVWDTIIMDVTDLKEFEELANRTAQIAKIGSWEIDLTSDGGRRHVYCSPTMCQILEEKEGYSPSVFEGLHYFTTNDFIRLKFHLEELIKNQSMFDLQFEVKLKNNTKKWIRCIGRVEQVNGRSVKLYGSIQDIEEQKRIESELIKLNAELEKNMHDLEVSNKELEQFAFVASHDLQEPLRMVNSFLSLLEKKYTDQLDEKAKSYIRFAVEGGERMRTIILDLLEFSRAGVSNKSNLSSVDLNSVMNDVQILLRKQIEDAGAKLEIAELPIIKGDHSRLRQVFQNLVSNAIKYRDTSRELCVSISVEEFENDYLVKISDNGIGMDEKYHQKVFELFQRLHNKDQYSGNGIGLSITKKIIESLGGEIAVESKLGEGSTFIVKFIRPDKMIQAN